MVDPIGALTSGLETAGNITTGNYAGAVRSGYNTAAHVGVDLPGSDVVPGAASAVEAFHGLGANFNRYG